MKLTLKEFFAGFLRTRHIGRHFRRLALLDSLTNTTVSREVPPTLAQTLVAAANRDSAVLIDSLGTHTDGLSEAEAEALRTYAEREGRSMNDVARAAIAAYVSERPQRLAAAIDKVLAEDGELLERLGR